MKKIILALLVFIYADVKGDYWTQKASFPGINRDVTFAFAIGTKGYIGCGQYAPGSVTNNFWEYDVFTNTWTQKADFGGAARWAGVGFSIGSKGYAGLGRGQNNSTLYQDFWEYNPITNTWAQKANFGGGLRNAATSFVIGNFGYVGTGFDPNHVAKSDLWQYNPVTNAWVQKADLGVTRADANSFTLNNNGYVVGGIVGLNHLNTLWEYNPISDSWSQKLNLPAAGRCDAAAFTICDKGYIGTGELMGGNAYANDFWQYNPITNTWVQKANFTGTVRDQTAYFVIDSKGYVGIGSQNGYATGIYFNDFWEYTPDSSCTTTITNIEYSAIHLQLTPNPAKDFITISFTSSTAWRAGVGLTITDVLGKIIYASTIISKETIIDVKHFAKGVYAVSVEDGKQHVVKKFLKN